WLGAIARLFSMQFENELFRPYNKTNDGKIRFEHVWYIYPEQKNKLFINAASGLIKIDSTDLPTYINHTSAFNYQFQVSNNEFIVSGNGKLNILKGNKLYDIDLIYREFEPFKNTVINSHLVLGD